MSAVPELIVPSRELILPERPDYRAIWQQRGDRLVWLRSDKTGGRWAKLRNYYRAGHIDAFINDWGVTLDPRNVRLGLPTRMPFVLDPKQREWCQWTWENWQMGVYGGSEKSRDVGLSWLAVGFSNALCTLFDGIATGLGSFKQEKVDNRGDMGSLFEKARAFLDGLPEELRAGYDPRYHSFERMLTFPFTKSSTIGEIGDNIGRGGRTSLYIVDEAAYLEHDRIVDAALSKNTDVRQDISSVRGMLNTFAERMHDGKSRKFTFHWRDNPRFTQTMYDEFLDQWGPVITAQELDINYQASVEGVVIPAEWVQAAIDAHLKLQLEPTGERSAAYDVADKGIDKNAFAARHGILLSYAEQFSGTATGDIYASVEKIFLLCDIHRCRGFVYDADGPGAGVEGDARKINEARAEESSLQLEVHPFRSSGKVINPKHEDVIGRKNEDFFENRKAQAWWALRVRFQETFRAVQGRPYDPSNIISIAKDFKDRARLVIELSQPVYTQSKAGKLMIDKTPDNMASPNLADAVMMLFSPGRPMTIADDLFDDDDIDP